MALPYYWVFAKVCAFILYTKLGSKNTHFIVLHLLKITKNMDLKQHIQHCILYEYDNGCSATAAATKIRATYGQILSTRTVQKWFKKFREGDRSLTDEPRSGRPQEIDNKVLLAYIEANSRATTKELAVEFGCNFSTVSRHLASLGKAYRCGKWVPHHLTDSNLSQRISICTSLLI